MKNFIIALLTVATLSSCGEDIMFNTPAIQGLKDGDVLFKSVYFASDIDNNGFLIEGGDNFEIIQLVTTIDAPGTYELGGNSGNRAIFKNFNGIVFSTAFPPDPSFSVYPADGQIIIEEVSSTEPKTITGKFWFNAYTLEGLRTVNFSEGEFYKVPLVGGLEEITFISCETATNNVILAEQAFSQTNPSMENYGGVCNNYKNQLTYKKSSCGDPDGSIQTLIDSLGDCN